MASLTNTKISDTYPLLLKIETNGVDGTLRSIEDGDGTTSALKISSGAIQVDNIKVDGNAITSTDSNGNIDLTPDGSGEVNISKVDIDSGTIDGVSINSSAIGGGSASTGAFTTISASGNVDFNGDLDVDGTTNLDAVDIDGATTITGTSAYASSATNLSTSVSKMALRVQGSSDASTSLWMGALANDAQQYIQACNDAGNGADEIILNPFGGKVGVGVGNASPTALFEVKTDDENIARFDGLQGNIDFRYGSDIEFDRAGIVYITANNGSGELQLRTGGQNARLHIDETGNVGIGETSPSERLHIGGDYADFRLYSRTGIEIGTLAFNEYFNGSAWVNDDSGIVSGAVRFSDSRDSLEFGVRAGGAGAGYSSTHMTIKSTGRVGIGTNDPSDQLTISNSGEASVAIIGSAGVGGGDATLYLVENTTDYGIRMRYDGGDDKLYINADEDTRNLMTIKRDGGGVGIGTTSPGENLHIKSDASAATTLKIEATASGQRADIALYGNYTGSDADFAEILFVNNGDSTGAIQAGRDGAPDAGYIKFTTQLTGGGMGERMRIGENGFVGINRDTNIHERLTVGGQVCSVGSSFTSSTAGSQRAVMDMTSNTARIGHFRGSNGAGSGALELYVDSNAIMKLHAGADPVHITQYGLGINCDNPGERSTSGTSQQYISVDGASNGAVVELVTSQNGDDYFMGAIDWVNAANGVSNANNAAGRLTAAIRAYTDTDDSNASDDSGAHMLFYTKPSAGSLTLRWSFNAEGYSTPYGSIIPAANNSYNLGSTSYRWSVLYTSNAVNVSDETLKTDIQDCDLGIDFINTLKPKSFKMKDLEEEHDDYDKKHYGLIAQDLKDGKFKDSVYGNKDGDYGLAYNDLIAPLVKAVQELSAKVEALENA